MASWLVPLQIEHLLFNCNITKNVWLAFLSLFIKQNISKEMLILIDIPLGMFNDNEDFAILNHVILIIDKAFIFLIEQN